VGLIYLMNILAVRGALRGGGLPLGLAFLKYGIYWVLIVIGSRFLSFGYVMGGFTAGIFLSLPVSYFVNHRMTHKGVPSTRSKTRRGEARK
jgi:hypothetical protein